MWHHFSWIVYHEYANPHFFPRASERGVLLIVVSVLCVCHTSSHLHIFTSSHSHTHIFTYSHLFLSLSHSHLHILTSSLSLSPLSSLLSLSPFSLPFLSLAFFIFLSLGRGWCRRGVTKRQPFRTKWGSMRKNWGKIAIVLVPDLSWSNPFARNEGRCAKTEVKLRFYLCRTCPGATLSHEMRVDAQKLR